MKGFNQMINNKLKDTVFLPIKPKYAKAIINGDKKVEFRKRFPASVKNIVIYSSFPDKKILGWFNVKEIEVIETQKAWEEYNHIGSIKKNDFFNYYLNKETATVIKVSAVYKYSEDAPTAKELGIIPPQSYCYLEEHTWNKLRELKIESL